MHRRPFAYILLARLNNQSERIQKTSRLAMYVDDTKQERLFPQYNSQVVDENEQAKKSPNKYRKIKTSETARHAWNRCNAPLRIRINASLSSRSNRYTFRFVAGEAAAAAAAPATTAAPTSPPRSGAK